MRYIIYSARRIIDRSHQLLNVLIEEVGTVKSTICNSSTKLLQAGSNNLDTCASCNTNWLSNIYFYHESGDYQWRDSQQTDLFLQWEIPWNEPYCLNLGQYHACWSTSWWPKCSRCRVIHGLNFNKQIVLNLFFVYIWMCCGIQAEATLMITHPTAYAH